MRRIKKLVIFIAVMIYCLSFSVFCFAGVGKDGETGNLSEFYDENEIQLFFNGAAWYKSGDNFYNDKGQVITGATQKGIDVSAHQGTIDWNQVKNSDVDFAIIRCGYAEDLVKYDDTQWYTNANACTNLGIPFGVYLYSYAENTSDAKSEAEHVLRLIKGYNLTFPVFFDMEDAKLDALSNDVKLSIAETFCTTIEAAGYPVGIYASKYWWESKLTSSEYNRWMRWVAQWNSNCTYSGQYIMWQSSSKGSVPGINGNVDIDFWIGTPRTIGSEEPPKEDEVVKVGGDINGDGVADKKDVQLILDYVTGKSDLTSEQIKVADINGDGVADVADALMYY